MKFHIVITSILIFFLGSCTSKEPSHNNFNKDLVIGGQGAIQFNATTLTSKALPHHFLSCLAKSDEQETIIIDGIIKNIQDTSSKNIVLYFHGGLSSQKYMVETLGPKLYPTFSDYNNDYYPIFIQYHAGVFDFVLDDKSTWDAAGEAVRENIEKSGEFQQLVSVIERKLGVSKGNSNKAAFKKIEDFTVSMSSSELETEVSAHNAYMILLESYGLQKKLDSVNKMDGLQSEYNQEVDIEFLVGILNQKSIDLNDSVKSSLNKSTPLDFKQVSHLDELTLISADAINSINNRNGTNVGDIHKLSEKGIISEISTLPLYKLRIARVLARIALRTDHGIKTTILEELVDMTNLIPEVSQGHWSKVKNYSKSCFTEGHNGVALISALSKLKSNNKISSINLLSHSAGAIPVGRLLQYADNNNLENIDNVSIIAPAVNQKDFISLYKKSFDKVGQLDVYPIRKQYERDDNIFLLPGSLLYWVSSIGEDAYTLDRMLLIEQHLVKKFPYNKWLYRKLAFEKQAPKVWDFFKKKDNANLIYYPFCTDGTCSDTQASHSGTKFLQQATDLAQCIFTRIRDDNFVCTNENLN